MGETESVETLDAETVDRVMAVWLAGKAPSTRRSYGNDLQAWARFEAAASAEGAVAGLLGGGPQRARERVRLWQDAMGRGGAAPATVNRRVACLAGLTEVARGIGAVGWRLEVPRLATLRLRDPRGPEPEAIRAMMAWARGRPGLAGPRDAAILFLLYGLALRRREVVTLDVEHVDIRRPAVAVLGKGRREREWLVMPLRVQEAVAEWMVARGGRDGPLFVTLSRGHRGERLTGKGVGDVVRRAGQAVGVRATPHGLRHSAITVAIRAGHALPVVQRFSRHRDLRTLQVYFDRIGDDAAEVATTVVGSL